VETQRRAQKTYLYDGCNSMLMIAHAREFGVFTQVIPTSRLDLGGVGHLNGI